MLHMHKGRRWRPFCMWSMWTLFYFASQKRSLRSLGGHPAALARGLARPNTFVPDPSCFSPFSKTSTLLLRFCSSCLVNVYSLVDLISAVHTLIFKTAYRYNQHAVFGTFVCIISYSGQYHQERRFLHPGSVNLVRQIL